MPASTPLCCACSRPVSGNWNLCDYCSDSIADRLRIVPDLCHELNIAFARWDDLGVSLGRGGDGGLPYSIPAATTTSCLTTTILMWSRITAEGRESEWCLPDTVGDLALWLCHRLDWLRVLDCVADAYAQIKAAVDRAWSVVDRPQHRTRFFVGPCPVVSDNGYCPGEIWAYVPTRIGIEPAVLRCREPGCLRHREPYTTEMWLDAGIRIERRRNTLLKSRNHA